MNTRDQLIFKTPASWPGDMWKAALPAGNGTVGIAVYGAVKQETVLINHSDLWHWGNNPPVPNVTDAFRETRRYIEAGDYHSANPLTSDALIAAGYDAQLYTPCQVADLKIESHVEQPFANYSRGINMDTGEVWAKWNHGESRHHRHTLVSRKDDIIVCEHIVENGKIGLDIWLQLHETYGPDAERMKRETNGKCDIYCKCGMLYYAIQNDDNTDFGAVVRVIPQDGELVTKKNFLQVCGCSRVMVLVKVFVKGNRRVDFLRCKEALEAFEETYSVLLERHATVHTPLYRSADIKLANDSLEEPIDNLLLDAYGNTASLALLEKLWRYGRYLFISGTAPHANPFSMYGLWGGRYDLVWSHNMGNINLQMMYWHSIVGGLSEFVTALLDYFENMLPQFKENAQQIFGMRGIYIPAGTTPGQGRPNQVVPVITNWIGGAGWICQHFYDYYLRWKDKNMLRERIFPFMLEAAAFYEDYLVSDADGLSIYPSVSPENTPGRLNTGAFVHLAHANPTTKNALMDIAIVRELFTNLIEASQDLELLPEKVREWKAILAKLPIYTLNEQGAVKEWLTSDLDDFYYHRHISHLYPVFPGREMCREADASMMQGFECAVDMRILGGQTAWSLAHMAAVFARFGRANKAMTCLNSICSSCLTPSMMTLHNDYRKMGMTFDLDDFAPIQLDAQMGIVNAIQEMLFFATPSFIKVLPACPDEWNCGAISGFHFFGGQISFEWNLSKRTMDCMIIFDQNADVTLQLPEWKWEKQDSAYTGNLSVMWKSDSLCQLQAVAGAMLQLRTENSSIN